MSKHIALPPSLCLSVWLFRPSLTEDTKPSSCDMKTSVLVVPYFLFIDNISLNSTHSTGLFGCETATEILDERVSSFQSSD